MTSDMCPCSTCRNAVTGEPGDPKVCVLDPAEGALRLCTGCYRRDPRRTIWERWAPELVGPPSWPMMHEARG